MAPRWILSPFRKTSFQQCTSIILRRFLPPSGFLSLFYPNQRTSFAALAFRQEFPASGIMRPLRSSPPFSQMGAGRLSVEQAFLLRYIPSLLSLVFVRWTPPPHSAAPHRQPSSPLFSRARFFPPYSFFELLCPDKATCLHFSICVPGLFRPHIPLGTDHFSDTQ